MAVSLRSSRRHADDACMFSSGALSCGDGGQKGGGGEQKVKREGVESKRSKGRGRALSCGEQGRGRGRAAQEERSLPCSCQPTCDCRRLRQKASADLLC
jgi:hypothetical protein